ncbi:MAG: DegT/DnrJ/EryC1/StrS family aminotransferase [Acidimicrobiales bacterium]
MRLHPRHRIDARGADVAFAALACVVAGRRQKLADSAERSWSPGGEAVACLSARSAFDLLLSALALPVGSEVLVSAVTIPAMAAILRDHGLVPVPVDLDPATLAPKLDLLDRLVTVRTRAVLVAHLFGGRHDLAPVVDLCRRHGLLLVEDCAQSFRGLGDTGTAATDVSLFSFGPIKTATAFGGGLARVTDPDVRARMRRLQDAWPVQTRWAFAARVVRGAALVALQHPVVYGVAATVAARFGRPLDVIVSRAARSCPEGSGHRRRPSAPLLAVLRRRLTRFDGRRLAERAARGEQAAKALWSAVDVPGWRQDDRTWWLFGVAVERPARLVRRLRAAGFDASGATSALTVVPAPPGRAEAAPIVAQRLLSRLVCLPVYPELPEAALRRLLRVTLEEQVDGRSAPQPSMGSRATARSPLST